MQPSRSPSLYRSTYRSRSSSVVFIVFLLSGLDLFGQLAGVDEAHQLVAEVGGWVEHAGAAAGDHGDAVLPAIGSGGGRDAAGAGPTVHPDVLDAELGTFAHGLVGDLGARADHDGL